LFAKLIDVPL